jgi:hypothetical protein
VPGASERLIVAAWPSMMIGEMISGKPTPAGNIIESVVTEAVSS